MRLLLENQRNDRLIFPLIRNGCLRTFHRPPLRVQMPLFRVAPMRGIGFTAAKTGQE